MERMGLWGDGAPFKNFEQFLDTVQRKGLGERPYLTYIIQYLYIAVQRVIGFYAHNLHVIGPNCECLRFAFK